MMPNDNIGEVHQHQMVVGWIRLRHGEIEGNKNKNKWSTYLMRTVNGFCSKILVL